MTRGIRSAAFLFLATLFFFLIGFFFLPDNLGLDFLQYWASARVLLAHGNPYDASSLLGLQAAVWKGDISDLPILMWNPPWIFPLIIPIAVLPFEIARAFWFALTAMLILVGTMLSIRLVAKSAVVPSILFAVTFAPFFSSVYFGQITPVLFCGLAGFLFLWLRSPAVSSGYQFLSGVSLSLTLLKPHLLFLVYLYVLFIELRDKRVWTILGCTSGLLALVFCQFCVDAQVFSQYLEAMSMPPVYWQTPTMGSWLQLSLGDSVPGIRFLPTVVAVILSLLVAFCRPKLLNTKESVYPLLAFSLVFSPYGWVYDQMLLLPFCFWLIYTYYHQARWSFWALVILNMSLLMLFQLVGQQYAIWYPLALLGLFCLCAARVHPKSRSCRI